MHPLRLLSQSKAVIIQIIVAISETLMTTDDIVACFKL